MNEVNKPTMQAHDRYVQVCVGDRCARDGAGQALYDQLKVKLKQTFTETADLRVKHSRASRFGVCKSGPLLSVQPDGVWYYDIDERKLDRIIDEHLIAGQPADEWVFHQDPTRQSANG